MSLTIQIDDTDIQKALGEALDRTGDLTPALKDIGEYFLLRTRERFDNEVAPGGNSWAPLAASTLKRKAKSKTDNQGILKATLLLRKTINYQVQGDKVVIGAAQEYGVYHQFGTKKMPARPFLGIDEQDKQEILAILSDHLRGF